MDGIQIQFSDSVEYLGVILDNKLTWKTHIEIAIHQFLNKKSPGPDGLKPIVLKKLPDISLKFLMTLYKMCVRFTDKRSDGV